MRGACPRIALKRLAQLAAVTGSMRKAQRDADTRESKSAPALISEGSRSHEESQITVLQFAISSRFPNFSARKIRAPGPRDLGHPFTRCCWMERSHRSTDASVNRLGVSRLAIRYQQERKKRAEKKYRRKCDLCDCSFRVPRTASHTCPFIAQSADAQSLPRLVVYRPGDLDDRVGRVDGSKPPSPGPRGPA